MDIHIKNMVCPRCIMAVKHVFEELSLQPVCIRLGMVKLKDELSAGQMQQVKDKLEPLGFVLLDDQRSQQIEKIKSVIIAHIHQLEEGRTVFSEVLADELNKEYSQLSKLFSATEGITIEQYVILQKTEKVKELLAYNQMNLSEIAYKMGYSSVAHLSAQFKKTTGLTPTRFKAQGIQLRKPLDSIR